jgi:hypothetical protein
MNQCEDGLRLQKVQLIIDAANQQFSAKDYGACLSSIENGLRIDAGACPACSSIGTPVPSYGGGWGAPRIFHSHRPWSQTPQHNEPRRRQLDADGAQGQGGAAVGEGGEGTQGEPEPRGEDEGGGRRALQAGQVRGGACGRGWSLS